MRFIRKQADQRGAVSIFIVIFFALLIGVITISFIGIVVTNTNQAVNADLSRSAYDSAQGGVEDAKRAIALTAGECDAAGAQCATYQKYLSDQTCHALPDFSSKLGLAADGTQVKIQSTDSNDLNQAYTCVNVTMNTPDYINTEPEYQSDVVPLSGTGAATGVTVQWFTHADGNLADGQAFSLPNNCSVSNGSPSCSLPRQVSWGPDGTPALLRVQLISYATGGPITDADLASGSRTLFLYPTTTGTKSTDFSTDGSPASASNPAPIVPVACSTDGTNQYACSVNIGLGPAVGKTAFLRVTPVYKQSTFRLQLTNGDNPVLFNGVQPIVDSTGRANDVYRRVEARVRLQSNALYPEFAVDTQNSFCKDYSIDEEAIDFVNKCH